MLKNVASKSKIKVLNTPTNKKYKILNLVYFYQ
jgi:hypothetical protein